MKRMIVTGIFLLSLLMAFNVLSQETEALPQQSEYEKGISAFAKGDFRAAADYWLADAYLGSADAQFNVGVLYVEGKGLRENHGEAIYWFRKSAKQGHLEAQYNLGHLLLEQHENVENITEGIGWWRRSAQGGFSIAQYNYGRALYYGIGIGMDRSGSKQWFERAANGGNGRAISFLEDNSGSFGNQSINLDNNNSVDIVESENEVTKDDLSGKQTDDKSEYVLVKNRPALMYARFNTRSPVIGGIGKKILLRVVSQIQDWILVEMPGGLPGWVQNQDITVDKDIVEITADSALVVADPTDQSGSNEIGKLADGTRVLLLKQQDSWTRVILPESIPGWIQQEAVDLVVANASEISRVWQAQRIKLKLAYLAERKNSDSALASSAVNKVPGEISEPLEDGGAGIVPEPRKVEFPGTSTRDGEILASGLTATDSGPKSTTKRTLKPPPDQ